MASAAGRLIIVCGLPGSGKTTHAQALITRHGGVSFSPDDWMDGLALDLWDQDRRARIENLQWQVAQQVLTVGGTAIIEWGTWSRAERDMLRLAARNLGASVELHYLTAEPDILFDRIHQRGREDPPITRPMLQLWASAFEEPTAEERALYDESDDQ
ncbi:AAA family ATPase [Devosia sp. A369]